MRQTMKKTILTMDSTRVTSIVMLALLIIPGCATIGKSTLLGAGIGGVLGSGIALSANNNTGGVVLGAGIGAAIGAGLLYLGHKDQEEKDAMVAALLRKKGPKDEYPTLRAPEASCTRVGEKIEGARYFGPHIVCDIEKQAVWGR